MMMPQLGGTKPSVLGTSAKLNHALITAAFQSNLQMLAETISTDWHIDGRM